MMRGRKKRAVPIGRLRNEILAVEKTAAIGAESPRGRGEGGGT